MYQQEIKFFWPLTEQIPLDLDYTKCVKPTVSISNNSGLTCIPLSGDTGVTWSTSLVADKIDVEKINFTLTEKPNIIKKLALKLLGISWKVK